MSITNFWFDETDLYLHNVIENDKYWFLYYNTHCPRYTKNNRKHSLLLMIYYEKTYTHQENKYSTNYFE